MNAFRSFLLAGGLGLAALASSASAQLAASAQGQYDSSGFFDTSFPGYGTGWYGSYPEYRSFFVFDRAAIGGTLTSATLQIFNPAPTPDYPEAGFTSSAPFETLSLFDVGTSLGDLLGGTFDPLTFDDLGSGTLFGSVDVSDADDGRWISVTLNSAFLDAFNQSQGPFAIGAAVTTLEQVDAMEAVFVGSDAAPGARLAFTAVPEPSTYALFGVSLLLALAAVRRRARRCR